MASEGGRMTREGSTRATGGRERMKEVDKGYEESSTALCYAFNCTERTQLRIYLDHLRFWRGLSIGESNGSMVLDGFRHEIERAEHLEDKVEGARCDATTSISSCPLGRRIVRAAIGRPQEQERRPASAS